MAKEGRSTVVPRLRFPEFHGPWNEHEIGKHLTESRILGNDGSVARKLTVKLWGNGVFEKMETIKGSTNTQYYKRKAGQFIYSKLDFLNQAFGIIPDHLDGYESTADLPCFDVGDGINPQFLLEYVQREGFYRRFGEIADGGRKAKRIQVESFLSFPIALPATLEEQRKVADCLASLDEVIAARGRKATLLKTHKRGLMQQLFPPEGETLPRLRFPEFRDGPVWEVRPLSELAENLDNRRVPVAEKDRAKGEIPYYGASGIVDYVKDYLFDEDLLCVSEDGANLVARTYPIAFAITGKTWVNNHAHVLRFDCPATQKLVELYLNSIDLRDFVTGMAQPKLNRAMLDSIPVPLPQPEEQQRIADCLAPLDAQIAAESEQLNALHAQKTGLMQHLFPSLGEAA